MTKKSAKAPLSEKLLRDLGSLATDVARKRFLAQHESLYREPALQQLNEIARAMLRSDTRHAIALVESAIAIAKKLRNKEALGRALRSKANALMILGENQKALEFHALASSRSFEKSATSKKKRER